MSARDVLPLVWIGPRAADAALLGAGGRSVAVFSGDTVGPHEPDVTVRSLEALTGVRRRWGAASMAEIVAAFGADIRDAARRAFAVVPYAMHEALPALVDGTGAKLVGPVPHLQHWLDDKRAALRIFDDARVTRLPYREMRAERLPGLATRAHTGRRLVVQLPRSSGGKGTHFVWPEAEELTRLASRLTGSTVLVSDFEEGSYSINAHFAVLPGWILIAPMSVQLVGISHCTSNEAGYSGNEFMTMNEIDPGVVSRAQEATRKVAASLASRGYRGLAGLDLLVAAQTDQIFPIDLNPRFQASTRALAEAERSSGSVLGFVDLAVGVELGLYGRGDLERYAAPLALPTIQLVFYHRTSSARRRRAGDDGTTRTVDGWSLTGLAPAGTPVESGAVLATVTGDCPGRKSPEAAARKVLGMVEDRYEENQ